MISGRFSNPAGAPQFSGNGKNAADAAIHPEFVGDGAPQSPIALII